MVYQLRLPEINLCRSAFQFWEIHPANIQANRMNFCLLYRIQEQRNRLHGKTLNPGHEIVLAQLCPIFVMLQFHRRLEHLLEWNQYQVMT